MIPCYIIIKPMKNLSILNVSTCALRFKTIVPNKVSALSLTFNLKKNLGYTRFAHFTKKTKQVPTVNKPVLVYKSPCMKNRYSSPIVLNRKFSVSPVLYTSDDELMSVASNLSKISDNEYSSDSSDLETKLNQTIEQKAHHMRESSYTRKEFRVEHEDWSDQVRTASLNLNPAQRAEFHSLEQRQDAQIEQLKRENREFNFGTDDEECRVHYDLLKNDINIKQYQHTKEREMYVEQKLATNVLSPSEKERLEQTGENLYSIARELKTYSTKIMRDHNKHETYARGLERVETERTSLLDDFADPSTEISDYFSGDD